MASSPDRYKKGTALSVISASVLGDELELSREERRRLTEAFKEYDYDDTGTIDKSEVRALLGDLKWGVDQNQLNDFIRDVFGDDSQAFNFEMFMKLYKAVLVKQPGGVRKQQVAKEGMKAAGKNRITVGDLRILEADLRGLFKAMDQDKTGYLSIPDLRSVLGSSGLPDLDGDNFETAVHEHLRIADTNKDGRVSFEEFVGYRNRIIEYCYGQTQMDADNGQQQEPAMLYV